ncbi:7730_t:CDS:2, partial [Scutellospora calospora]
EDRKKYPVLKIILSEVVHLTIDPSNLLIFPILINMTAVAIEISQIESDNIILTVETKDYVDQDYITQKLEYYHLKSAQHLAPTTSSVKAGSVLFISINLKTLANLSWLNETPINKSNNKPTFLNQVSTNKLNTITMLLNEISTDKLGTEVIIQNESLTNESSAETATQNEPLNEESCTETTT